MIIDSHQHFWQLDKPFNYQWLNAPVNEAINRDFLPKHLAENMADTGVNHSVFVQTQHNIDETRWVFDLAEDNEFIVGIVGWVDLANEACESQVEELIENPLFVGVRHITQDEPDDNFIIRPDVLEGLQVLEKFNVPFDLLFYTKHLKHAANLAERMPGLPMVIDHLSKPQIKGGLIDEWRKDLRAASLYPNVYCKLSGMITEADWDKWTVDDLRPYVETAIECFGPDRCMYGSDWPVCELAGSYKQVFEALNELVGQLSESERQSIFCDTARQFYRLKI